MTVFSRRWKPGHWRARASTSSTAGTYPLFPPQEILKVSQLYGRYAVAINRNSERYADEAADWSETALTQATARQPGLRAWYLLDREDLRGRIRARTVKDMVETARRVGGTVLGAETLEELAERLAGRGAPKANVLRTLAG